MAATDTFVDYYKVFGLKPSATDDEIRRSYLQLAKQHHPDTGGNERSMRLVNEAYAVLRGEARVAYDRRYKAHHEVKFPVVEGSRSTASRGAAADYMRHTYTASAGSHSTSTNRSRRSLVGLARLAFVMMITVITVVFGMNLASAMKRSPAGATPSSTTDVAQSEPLPNITVPEYAPSSDADTTSGALARTINASIPSDAANITQGQDMPPPDVDTTTDSTGSTTDSNPNANTSPAPVSPVTRYRCHRPIMTEDAASQHIVCPMTN